MGRTVPRCGPRRYACAAGRRAMTKTPLEEVEPSSPRRATLSYLEQRPCAGQSTRDRASTIEQLGGWLAGSNAVWMPNYVASL